LRDPAHLPYKAADVIGGNSADNIGGFIPGQCLFAQGHFENPTAAFQVGSGTCQFASALVK
jgi:hypothetical protein